MENPVNYASLIQLAVTFNFVFVVFRYQSEDKAKMLIDTLIEKWKEQFQEETNALFAYSGGYPFSISVDIRSLPS